MSVRTTRRKRKTQEQKAESEPPRPSTFTLEEHCLAVLLRQPAFLERANILLESLSLPPLLEDDFERAENRALYAAWLQVEDGSSWEEWEQSLPHALQIYLDFLLGHGSEIKEPAPEDAERDIERTTLTLRHRHLKRISQNLRFMQAEALESGDAKAIEYGHTMVELTGQITRLEYALLERTSLGKSEERERVL
jgi:hypothetical protein